MEGWERIRANGYRWRVRPAARAEVEKAPLAPGTEPGRRYHPRTRRRGRSYFKIPSQAGGLFVKRFTPRRYDLTFLYRALRRRLRCQVEFRAAVRIHRRGAPVPEPLAFGSRHRWFRSYESVVVYRLLPEESRNLPECDLPRLGRIARARLAEAVAGLAVAFHERGIFHLDMGAFNIMLEGDPAGEFRLSVVDLENTVLGRPGDLRLVVWSLGKMLAKTPGTRAAERLRFLDAYLAARPGLGVQRRALWNAVAEDRDHRLRLIDQARSRRAGRRRANGARR